MGWGGEAVCVCMCMHRESVFPNCDQTWADHKTEDNGNLQGFFCCVCGILLALEHFVCVCVCVCLLIYLLVTHRGLFLGL